MSIHHNRLIRFCCIGTALEWYDFSVFGALLPILSQLFFPETNQITTSICAFTLFSMGLIARPLGAFLFGFIGDRWGRKRSTLMTVLLMGIATTTMGCLPTYESVGVISALLLGLLRITQGLSGSGEIAGVLTYLFESVGTRRQYFLLSLVNSGSFLGGLLGTLTVTGCSYFLSQSQLLAWGWRIPFLLGVLTALFGFLMRLQLLETPIFQALKRQNQILTNPMLDTLKHYKKHILATTGMFWIATAIYHTLFVYLPMQLVHHNLLSISTVLTATTLITLMIGIFEPLFALACDISNQPFRIQVIAIIGLVSLAYPLLFYLQTGYAVMPLIPTIILFICCHSAFCAPFSVLVTKPFQAWVRYTGTALAYNLAIALFGGTTPMTMFWLAKSSEPALYQSIYILSIALISLFSARFIHRRLLL